LSAELVDIDAVGASLMRLERLPIAQKPLRGELWGDYESLQAGDGYEIADLRTYETGDDSRDINVPATMRSVEGEVIVETHVAENVPAFHIVSDIPSHRYHNDTPGLDEQRLGLALTMVTTLMARRDGLPTAALWSNGNKLSYSEAPATDDVSLLQDFKRASLLLQAADLAFAASQNAPKGFFRRFKRVEATPTPEPIYLGNVLSRLGDVATSESVITIVSDFRDVKDPQDAKHGWARPLGRLASQHHVVAIKLTNPWYRSLPKDKAFFTDPETGKIISIDDIPGGRQKYAALQQEREETIQDNLRRGGAQQLTIDTATEDWVGHLEKQMRKLRGDA